MSEQGEPTVLVEREGLIAIVTLNAPKRRNAFSLAMREALYQNLHALMHEAECCAIVLTGAAGTFCAGGDISEMQERTLLEYRERNLLPLDVFRLMVTGPKPVVAAVEGYAMGAGVSLAAAADYVVSAENVRYACAFVKVGLLPDSGIYWSLAQRVGPAKARELLMTAREFDGAEAGRIGFANEVVAAGSARAKALEIAAHFTTLPPVTLALLKSALATGTSTIEDACRVELDLNPLTRQTQDHHQAVAAFLEKRKPHFIGR